MPKFGQFILKAKDEASKVLTKVNGMLRSFASKVWSATVSVKDKASSVLSSIQGKLSALALGATVMVGAKTGFNELANEQTRKLTINRVIKNSGKYFGKVLIKFNKDFQQGCVKYITVANRMEVIDTNYNFEER